MLAIACTDGPRFDGGMAAHTLRPIGKNDFAVIDGGTVVGRIRHAAERTNDIWMWHVTIPIPGGAPYGHAGDLEAGTEAFRDAWVKFKAAAGPEALARAIETQDNAAAKGAARERLIEDNNNESIESIRCNSALGRNNFWRFGAKDRGCRR